MSTPTASTTAPRQYAVFISYRHADNLEMGRKWANWLHEALESYEVPPDLVGRTSLRGDKVPAALYPVFRDEAELIARIRTRLRRTNADVTGVLTIGDLTIDVTAHEVHRGAQKITLTRLEFDLLVALAKDPGRVFTRDALLSEVWGYRHSTDTRLVNVHVQRLRSKIEHDPEHPEIVMTVRGVGYKAGGAS